MRFDLSVVIPAFNEAAKIGADVKACAQFLTSRHLTGEILVVDDGSTDDTAGQAEQAEVPGQVHREVIRLQTNQGKGHAVRTGVLRSRGDLILCMDSGACVPLSDALVGIEMIRSGRCKIAIGTRRTKDCRICTPQPLHRRVWSRFFQIFIRATLPGLGHLTDTQCGFKVFQGDVARQIFAQCLINGFLFDIEVLLLAMRKDHAVLEFPITWTCDLDSRLVPGRSLIPILRDWARLRRRLKSLPDDP